MVVASCSPLMHEPTFRGACEEAGLNRYPLPDGQHPRALLLGDIDREDGDGQGQALVAGGGAGRVWHHMPLEERSVPVNPRRWWSAAASPGSQAALRDRRLRQEGLPGRAGAVDRRAHGPVRQDLPHAGLRRLHPDAQDGRRSASTRTSSC